MNERKIPRTKNQTNSKDQKANTSVTGSAAIIRKHERATQFSTFSIYPFAYCLVLAFLVLGISVPTFTFYVSFPTLHTGTRNTKDH